MTRDFGEFLIRGVEASDVAPFAADMRVADRRELRRWTGNTPEYELARAVELSDVLWLGTLKDGTPLSMFGGCRQNSLDGTGVIWELSTNAVDRHRVLFARASRICLDLVCRELSDVAEFQNFVDSEYEAAVRWIEWLGGSMSIGGGFRGTCGGKFLRFIIENPYFKEV